LIGGRHIFFKRRIFRGSLFFGNIIVPGPAPGSFQGDLLRCADTGDNVFALCVDQVFTVEKVFAGGRIAREGDTGGAAFAAVAKDHGLYVNGGPPVVVKTVHLAVQDGTCRVPRHEYSTDRAPQLFFRICREFLAEFFYNKLLEAADQFFQIGHGQVEIRLDASFRFQFVHDFFERIVGVFVFGFEAHDDIAVHLDKSAVGIPAESLVA